MPIDKADLAREPIDKADLARDCRNVFAQGLIVGEAGHTVGKVVRKRDADRPHEQEWGQHPVENLAKQRALDVRVFSLPQVSQDSSRARAR